MVCSIAAMTCTLPNGTESHLNLRDETDARLFGAYLQETTDGALVVVAEGVVSSDLPSERVTELYRAWRKRR